MTDQPPKQPKPRKPRLKKPSPTARLTGRRGKPRRGAKPSAVSTVRIDPDSKLALQAEFGSLGNALYFIASGLKEFRERRGLKPPPTDEGGGRLTNELNKQEILTLMQALEALTRDTSTPNDLFRAANRLYSKLSKFLEI